MVMVIFYPYQNSVGDKQWPVEQELEQDNKNA